MAILIIKWLKYAANTLESTTWLYIEFEWEKGAIKFYRPDEK